MRLLLAEDDPTLVELLAKEFQASGFVVDSVTNGEDARYWGAAENYDAIILDLGLPGVDGVSALRFWRDSDIRTPVLVLTARSGWHSKVQILNMGADDYLTKPFEMAEVLARIRALIRRAAGLAKPLLCCGNIAIDTLTGKVSVNESPIELTAQEFRTLSYLMHRQGQIVSRTELSEHIYAQDSDPDSNTIEVFIGRIRRKLGVDNIRTIRGLGYRLEVA